MKSISFFILLFISSTVIGTLTHELGHYTIGEIKGFNCKLSYASCACLSKKDVNILDHYKSMLKIYGSTISIPKIMGWHNSNSLRNNWFHNMLQCSILIDSKSTKK